MTTAHGTPDARVGGAVPLPKPPGVMRRFWAARPRLVDWLLAVGTQLPVLLIGTIAAATNVDLVVTGITSIAVALAAGAAVLHRRRWPLATTIVIAALLLIPSEIAAGAFLAIYVALYSVGAYATAVRAWIGVAAASVASLVASLVMPTLEPMAWGPVATINLVGIASFVVAVLAGTSVRARRAYVDALIARADDLAREREKQAQLAVADERARIAREMHDVVSHGLTVMVTLAEGSAAQASRDPDRAADTMRRVADTGRDSLTEMRRLLGVLRSPVDSAALAPQPAAGDLHMLVASFRDAGMPVRLATTGAPIADQSLALTVHRIVQEALTNVMRHASDAGRVEVDVVHAPGVVRVRVLDDGSRPPATTTGAGRGLVGMRERVALFGGSLEAGSREPRGWLLVATLHEPAAPAGAAGAAAAEASASEERQRDSSSPAPVSSTSPHVPPPTVPSAAATTPSVPNPAPPPIDVARIPNPAASAPSPQTPESHA